MKLFPRLGRRIAWTFTLVSCASMTTPALKASAESHHFFALGLGMFDPREDQSAEARLEYRFKVPSLYLFPIAGVMATTNQAAHVYSGLRADLSLSKSVILGLFGGLGSYWPGDGKELGGPFLFLGGFELAHKLDGGLRLGLGFYHISNGYTQDLNPGAESLNVLLEWPL